MEIWNDFTSFLQKIERPLGIAAGIIIVLAQVTYLVNIIKRKVTPSILSWYGWAALMGTSFISQLIEGWQWSLTGLILSTLGSIVIGTTAFFCRNFSFNKKDWKYIVFGLICVVLYQFSKNAWYTTGFAILADLLLGIPTIENAYEHPQLERSAAWLLGVTSWSIALLVCINHNLLYALFPMYLFLFNGTMVVLTGKNRTPR